MEAQGRRAIAIAGDIGEEAFCQQAVQQTVDEFGHLDKRVLRILAPNS